MARQFTISLDYKTVLPLIAAFMLGLGIGWWQPWQSGETRLVTVTGDATISATPDEYIFYPSFTATAKTANEATAAAKKTGDAVVKKIQELGVTQDKIKTDISSSPSYDFNGRQEDEYQSYFMITATINDFELAQKVQDYLLTTDNTGSSSPQSGFSEAKATELKAEARKQAVENAKTQGQQIAAELDSTINEVQSVEEVTGFDSVIPMYNRAAISGSSEDSQTSSELLVGEQDLTFSVKVIFSLK